MIDGRGVPAPLDPLDPVQEATDDRLRERSGMSPEADCGSRAYPCSIPTERFNCYLCGEKIAAKEESERVERGSLILSAHSRCLKSQQSSAHATGST